MCFQFPFVHYITFTPKFGLMWLISGARLYQFSISAADWNHLGRVFFSNFIVVQVQFSAFSPQPSLTPSPPHHPPISTPHYCPCVLSNCSYKHFTLVPWKSLPSPLWSLSACSQFQCLWLYFACLFVLLIRFLLKVRSYGICLSLPGLFRLA